MALSKKRKIELIRQANELELLYARFLNVKGIRNLAIQKLKEVCTEKFVEKEIIPTYNKKLKNGEYASDNSQFPVPDNLEEFVFHKDGSVSFPQHVFLRWSSGQVDNFETIHTYYFKNGKIDREEGPEGIQIRRKAK